MIDFKILLEIFGYMGTALVIVSMLMTSVVKLRLINICGGAISTVYAAISGTWPIVLLNVSLIIINFIQLIRMARKKKIIHRVKAEPQETGVMHLLDFYAEDIKKYFPAYTASENEGCEVHVAYIGTEAAGLVIGTRDADAMLIKLDYAIPKYRDLSISTFLFSQLAKDGVAELRASTEVAEHRKYLVRMGFSEDGETMTKSLKPKEETYEA